MNQHFPLGKRKENQEASECFLSPRPPGRGLGHCPLHVHREQTRPWSAAESAHAAWPPGGSWLSPAASSSVSHTRSHGHAGSIEGTGALALELGPSVAQLHEDHPGLLLIGLPSCLWDLVVSRASPALPPCSPRPRPRPTPTLPGSAPVLTLSGCTTSTARRYCFLTCPGVTRSAMPTGVQRLSPSHSTVCSVDSRARMFLSLPSVQSRSYGTRGCCSAGSWLQPHPLCSQRSS